MILNDLLRGFKMKTIKTVLLGASAIMLTANAFAATVNNKTLRTETVASKDAAYSLGVAQLQQLESVSGYQLNNYLVTNADTFQEKNSVTLTNGGYVTVQESMTDQGNIVYTGLVNVIYTYDNHD
jgi:hypothetical protein